MQKYHNTIQAENGDIITTATITVFLANTGVPATRYQDIEIDTYDNPFDVSDDNYDSKGMFFFKAENGTYDIKIVNGIKTTWLDDISLLDADSIVDSYDNIAALRAITTAPSLTLAKIKGYYTDGDGGGGDFYWDASSTETDNGGTIIKAISITTGRWKRPSTDISMLEEWGCVGGGSIDDSSAIAAAFASGVKELQGLRVYKLTTPISVSGVSTVFNIKGRIESHVVGTSFYFADNNCTVENLVTTCQVIDQSNPSIVGVELRSQRRKTINIRANGFTKGLYLNASSAGNIFGYLKVYADVNTCKTGLHVHTDNGGWATSTDFYSLQAGGVKTSGTAIAVHLEQTTGVLNTMRFYSPTIEACDTAMYFDITDRGSSVSNGYFEGNDIDNIKLGVNVDSFEVFGGFATTTHFRQVSTVLGVDTEVLVFASFLGDEFIVKDNGIFKGQTQAFSNLYPNSNFKQVDASGVSLLWNFPTVTDVTYGIVGQFDRTALAAASKRFSFTDPRLIGKYITLSGYIKDNGFLEVGDSNGFSYTAYASSASWERFQITRKIETEDFTVGVRVDAGDVGLYRDLTAHIGQNVAYPDQNDLSSLDLIESTGIPTLEDATTVTIENYDVFTRNTTTGISIITSGEVGKRFSILAANTFAITNSASIICPGAANISMTNNDVVEFIVVASNIVKCISYSNN